MAIARSKLAQDGPEVSRLVSGMGHLHEWGFEDRDMVDWIHTCLDIGITTFSHADIYGDYSCEARFGEGLQLDPSIRERIELVTKCGIALISDNHPEHTVKHYNTTKAHIIASAERSLENFHTDYLDVLLIHRPDPLMNADEIAEAFNHLKQSGKVRYFGVSNFTPAQFDLLQSRLDYPLVTNHIEHSVVALWPLNSGVFDQMQQYRLSPMVWSPLGGGIIFNPRTDREKYLQGILLQVGQELGGVPVECVALAWLMYHPANLIPVLGSGKIERLQSAADAIELKLDRQQWYRILQASAGHDVP